MSVKFLVGGYNTETFFETRSAIVDNGFSSVRILGV